MLARQHCQCMHSCQEPLPGPSDLCRHVWTAPFRQEAFDVVGARSGAVMYPACQCGRMLTAGPDGLRGSASMHCGALLGAMTSRRVPIQVLTIVPSLPVGSLRGWTRRRRGLGG